VKSLRASIENGHWRRAMNNRFVRINDVDGGA
jgi:hypothetical protein